MYAETYPHLKAKYDVDNFEVIMEVIDKHFSDIFDLDVLESESTKPMVGSFSELFNHCMSKLEGLYTTEEVVLAFSKALTAKEIIPLLTKHYVFVPPLVHKRVSQIGYFEKLASGQLSTAEPLTFLDMLRSAQWMDSHGGETSQFTVSYIKNLHTINWREKPVIFVNFNKNPRGIPKWGVVDLRTPARPKVYCEAPLFEEEKSALDQALQIKVAPDCYEGGISAFSISTGYTALAYANEKVKHTSALTLHSDFYALVEEFIFIQLTLRNPPVVNLHYH